jgi:uncharacterized protein (TIGR02284 family)
MSNPSATLLVVEGTLQSLIESLIDGQKGFQKMAEHLNDPTLKHYFLEESLLRAEFRGDLETVLHHEGVHDIAESGTMNGTLHRIWGELKSILGAGDQSLLDEAKQDGVAAIMAYSRALEKELPLPVRQLLSTQAAHIQLFNEYMTTVRYCGE